MRPSGVHSEEGAVAVLIAGVLVFLMAFAWLAIDAGLGLDDRRGTQNAADLAALAAAWEFCNPVNAAAPDPEQAGIDAAADNGYPDAAPGDHPQVEVTGPGSTWTVEITEVNDTVFGAAGNAPEQIQIVSTATARCRDTGILGGYALFGSTFQCPAATGGGSGFWEVNLSGQNVAVPDGSVHANDDLLIEPTGSWTLGSDEEVTYIDTASVSAGVTATQAYARIDESEVIDLKMVDYRPGELRASAAGSDYHSFGATSITATSIENYTPSPLGAMNGTVLEISEAGIYYTSSNVDFSSPVRLIGDALNRGVTFVSEGTMHFKQIQNLVGYDPYFSSAGPTVAMFAGGGGADCNGRAIDIDGVSANWRGIAYAPNGEVYVGRQSAASARPTSLTVDGSIVGYWVTLEADSMSITYRDDPSAPRQYRVDLLD